MYLLLILLSSISVGVSQVVIQLVESQLETAEGNQFTIHVQMTGIITDELDAVVTLQDPGGVSDFIGTSQVAKFIVGGENVLPLIFTVKDDDLPELTETYIFALSDYAGDAASLGLLTRCLVTIIANDDAYGVFTFRDTSPLLADEDTVTTIVNLRIGRSKGTFGQVSIHYQVQGTSFEAVPGEDVTPSTGSIVFQEGEKENYLQLQIRADNLAENDEDFNVTLSSASQGARVENGNLVLTIRANDAPIRFAQETYHVEESTSTTTVNLRVTRGLNQQGVSLGSISSAASVEYYLLGDTATLGIDFTGDSGQIIFEADQREASITVEIKGDQEPEMDESFQVILSDPLVGDVILGSPNTATVVISSNDNPNGVLEFTSLNSVSTPTLRVNEDANGKGSFYVTRRFGSFGTISVSWEVIRYDGTAEDVSTDISPETGTLVFVQGQTEKQIYLTAVTDVLAEPTENFIVRLMPNTVTGGAEVKGITQAIFIIEDSDEYYGVIEFDLDSQQRLVVIHDSRVLELKLTRTGSTIGDVAVNISVLYSVNPSSDVLSSDLAQAIMASGQIYATVQVSLKPSAFLQIGATFQAAIIAVDLVIEPLLGTYNSPTEGARNHVIVPVSADAANGEIGFKSVETVTVEEPETIPFQVYLLVSREGTNGAVTVSWSMTGTGLNSASVTPTDTGIVVGSVTLPAGIAEGTIIITIMPDDDPEVDEEVTVMLTGVNPPDWQKLKAGASRVKIVIAENDNPRGIFQFAAEMQAVYTQHENDLAIDVVIARTGGTLLQQHVQTIIEPDGDSEFYGSVTVLLFEPGDTQKTYQILAIKDGIPELLETFTLRLVPYGESAAVIGAKSSIIINVLENENPYGVIQFRHNPTVAYINESRSNRLESIIIEVDRLKGTFLSVHISWNVVPGDGQDLLPITGTITFGEHQTLGFLQLQSVADDIPEELEVFKVVLSEPSDGAILGNPIEATVIINANDYPMHFVETTLYVKEPSSPVLILRRDQMLDQVVTVNYMTVDNTAVGQQLDYQVVSSGQVTFHKGETDKTINIDILDDMIPETNETFMVQVYSIEGDYVMSNTNNATIVIMANDNAYGIFHFGPLFLKTVEEGSEVQFDILRDGGLYGSIGVIWETYDSITNIKTTDGGEFKTASGMAIFLENQQQQTITLTPRLDGVPEKDKTYRIVLSSLEVLDGLTEEPLATLSSSETMVYLTVIANDDPYGQFAFSLDTKSLRIAEDYDAGDVSLSIARFIVERRQGTFGQVAVAWEMFSNSLAGTFPKIYDLLFLGDVPTRMIAVTNKRRPGTGSTVAFFSGDTNQWIDVFESQHPDPSEMGSSLTISAWVQPTPSTNGYIVAKTTRNGSRHFYTLQLIADPTATMLRFGYSLSGSNNNQFATATASRGIDDGRWHQVIISVDSLTISFYLDGTLISTSSVVSQLRLDLDGSLIVGAISPGTQLFTGYMQDVRIYSGKLEQIMVDELYNTPSVRDVRPISGFLTFPESVRQSVLTVGSIQDVEEESSETFMVLLMCARGGATLSDVDSSAVLTVEKSDSANGIFGFDGKCQPEQQRSESQNITCVLTRRKGDDGSVEVTWQIYQLTASGAQIALDDFVQSTGSIIFQPGDRLKTFVIPINNDNTPELLEIFEIRLISVLSDDGISGTTNTSGASIDAVKSTSTIIIEANDYPFGLVQFSSDNETPIPGTIILPAVTKPVVNIKEEIGILHLLVMRAGGSNGEITVEWRTTDGTAKSEGKVPPDFQSVAGKLTFAEGIFKTFIDINIIDNAIPEDTKSFDVSLMNPTGGALLAIGANVTVIIAPSDGAFGLFQFSDSSLNVQGNEEGDLGFNIISLQVARLGGRIGSDSVIWQVVGDPGSDLVEQTGTVVFNDGDSSANLDLKIRGDTAPEMDEEFQIQLTSAAKGSLGDTTKLIAVLKILANDDPYGVFIIPNTQRPIRTEESFNNVTINIQRIQGRFGTVNVDFETLAPTDTYPYLPVTASRANNNDFRAAFGTIQFKPDQEFAILNVVIMDDIVPEEDESIFVRLIAVRLVDQLPPNPGLDSPRKSLDSESFAQIIINSNDNAHGVLELSALTSTVSEGEAFLGISILRKGGTFGEVTVRLWTIDGTAIRGLDYRLMSDVVTIPAGQSSASLPIEIVDDVYPELAEMFTVEILDQTTGGAVIGSPTQAVITIALSDDPNGLFEFSVDSVTVEEPESGQPFPVDIIVTRRGGTMDIVEVHWEATLNGELALTDVNPTSGKLHFLSNEASRAISMSVLPDDLPEGQEDIQIKIMQTTNSARIGNRNTFVLTIPANDNPHGFVQLTSKKYTVEERETNSIQLVNVIREGGTFGKIRLFYSTEQTDLGQSSRENILTYFNEPQPGSRATIGNSVVVNLDDDAAVVCGTVCLGTNDCLSFEVSITGLEKKCTWFTTSTSKPLIPFQGYTYYSKNVVMAQGFLASRASPNLDFGYIINEFIEIDDGQALASIPLNILADTFPELNETFQVVLSHIDVISPDISPTHPPRLGDVQKAVITILKNDNPNGIFHLRSDSPFAYSDGQIVPVEEVDRLAVDLIVERQGGSIADVSVDWRVNTSMGTTAVYGQDYIADGATLNFMEGETRKLITLTILDDQIPEDNKTITVELANPQGGADLSTSSSVLVIILENDNIGGLVGFQQTSVLASEGDMVQLNVTRTVPARGKVTLDWLINGLNGLNPAMGFQSYLGTLTFLYGETWKTLTLSVLTDDRPELNEEYQIILQNIQTTGVGPTGEATIDPLFKVATVTIKGSNNPHGVVEFASGFQTVRVEEQNTETGLQVDRKFGAIGIIRVSYIIAEGSVSAISEDLILAKENQDFLPQQSFIDFGEGVAGGTIQVSIKDDEIAEVDEVFIVTLTNVQLLSPASNTMQPKLGTTNSVAQVIINANDGTKGVVKFAPDSFSVTVDELDTTVSLTVVRDRGTFGNVSVFYYAESIAPGTTSGLDYIINPQELLFTKGEDRKLVLIQIINDNIPEPDEIFEVILRNPTNGLEIGQPSRAQVKILANDGASGTVNFDSTAVITMDEPEQNIITASKTQVTIVRGPGFYGVVNVPFQVIPEVGTNINDITPMQGIVTFEDTESSAILEINVLDDSLPEELERFTLQLRQPDNNAELGDLITRTVVITANDSPFGLLSIHLADGRKRRAIGDSSRTLDIEENQSTIDLEVERTQGMLGQITVDMATQAGTAVAITDLNEIQLAVIQTIASKGVTSWHSFTHNSTMFVVMLVPTRVGELTTTVGSTGSDGTVIESDLSVTTIFRWAGELVPIQTIETDGASKATTLDISGATYLVIANLGNPDRYETASRVYKVGMNGTLLVIQDLPTSGARDVASYLYNGGPFLVFANSKNNANTGLVNSVIHRWDVTSKIFVNSPWQEISTLQAWSLEIFTMEGRTFLVITNYYDDTTKTFETESIIYRLSDGGTFAEYQRIATQGAMDVVYIEVQSLNLLVFGNNRGDTIGSPQSSPVYRWNTLTQMFLEHEQIDTNRIKSLETYTGEDNTVYLVVSNGIGSSAIYSWDVQRFSFVSRWTGDAGQSLYPIVFPQTSGNMVALAVASTQLDVNAALYQIVKIKDSDYAPRTLTLIFNPGETKRRASVVIIPDTVPEDTETFYIVLINPTGGAEIGLDNRIMVNILSNDNAHGIINFAPDSLDMKVKELDGRDNIVQVNIIRQEGYFGAVTVRWVATGDQDGTDDLSPLEGSVELANGQSTTTISIKVRDDDIAELAEVTYIQLLEVVVAGTSLPARGAQIGQNNRAKLTVLANDSPYGVVKWKRTIMVTPEPDGTDHNVILYVQREQGLLGHLQVNFITSRDILLPPSQQATSGEDYISRQDMLIMQENITEVPVELVIKQDDIPEAAETFLVNITGVTLVGGIPAAGAEPSIAIPGAVTRITILENDNARGIVLFNVITNIEGRIDVYEEYGKNVSVALTVSRTIGIFGAITVTWQAEQREASLFDFYPSSGTLRMGSGEQSADIHITILDDTIPEEMESFDIKLISVSGGALIGPLDKIRVAILKNDSPTGLFRFTTSEVIVREAAHLEDQNGIATLMVERIQGAEGVVQVQWRLNAEASYDFQKPLAGTLQFGQGETTKPLILTTQPDDILEGEERFRVSLINANNNADISSTQGDAMVIVLPDPSASGIISVMPDSRKVYIGEPGESSASYSGKVEIMLTRGMGIYGTVKVTWSLTPRNNDAFLQVEGTVSFVDLQQTAAITIQAADDTVPEVRTTYTLQINSATGGAIISSDPDSYTAEIVFVASDYPHGLFEFTLPEFVSTTEDIVSVIVPIIRRSGLNGQVLVSYTTSPGTAQPYVDYLPSAGTVTFQQGGNRQQVEVHIKPDDIPEGPEYFLLNITSARLINPSDNDYSVIDGLQLDMEPDIGQLSYKTVLIDKNDNAEGTLQFAVTTLTVSEESPIASLLVLREGGTYGQVGVLFKTRNLTATADVDYFTKSGEAVFADGKNQAYINITLRDDSEMEFNEKFMVILTGTTGGALTGTAVAATVTIAKSDFPNGKFEFKGQQQIILANPKREIQQLFAMDRSGGLLGQQTVLWRIMGPNNPDLVLEGTNDIAHVAGGREVTSGSLYWTNGESGQKTFKLNIKPSSNWEEQKSFIIQIYQIDGYPVSAGNGEISPTHGSVTLVIAKFGHPNGIVRFDGPAQLQRTIAEPEGLDVLKLRFPVVRREDTGTVGNIRILWQVVGNSEGSIDFQPTNGTLILANKERDGEIVLDVIPDNVPELTEKFNVVIYAAEGGAEIDTQFSSSTFYIKFNDKPHGVFGILPEDQAVIVNPSDMARYIRLNFTRHAGTFGSVILTFTVNYDDPNADIVLTNNVGTLTFEDGQMNVLTDIPIKGDGFMGVGSTFTISLTEVAYLGAGVTEPPAFKDGERVTKVTVPPEAANSRVSFLELIIPANEALNTALLTVYREGTYGTVNVGWRSGYPEGDMPDGFAEGNIRPPFGFVILVNGIDRSNFTVHMTPNDDRPELFTVTLSAVPTTSVPGGAQLLSDRAIARIDPYGLILFDLGSIKTVVTELTGKIDLIVKRLYGSLGKIEVSYRVQGINADSGFDFITMNHLVVMEPKQTSAALTIQVIEDNRPEEAEKFLVNLTTVEKYPTETMPFISPRLSAQYFSSEVTIQASNDPYGVLSLEPREIRVVEQYQSVNFTVRRTGGIYGLVSVRVRTVGGGETWTQQIVPHFGTSNNNTISDILGSRDDVSVAIGGLDYEVMDTVITFSQGVESQTVVLTILADDQAEPDEIVIVYLTQPVGGARIAEGTPDGGRKGFALVTVDKNDLSNGIVGFSEDWKAINVDEDTQPVFPLKLTRYKAFYGEIEVSWIAKVDTNSDTVQDSVLGSQLVNTAGTAVCPAQQATCFFDVSLINDKIPEESHEFYIKLVSVRRDAMLNENSVITKVTVEPSDYIRGLIGFTSDSRVVDVKRGAETLRLKVERTMGQSYRVEVGYSMMQTTQTVSVHGIQLYPALLGEDFSGDSGKLVFEANIQEIEYIDVDLTPQVLSTNPFPKQFYVQLKNPTNGASINPEAASAIVRIVEPEDLAIWNIVTLQDSEGLTDSYIIQILTHLDNLVQKDLSNTEVTLIESMLNDIADEALSRKLPDQILNQLMNVICKMLNPNKNDATRGRVSFTLLMEKLAYSLLQSKPCPTPPPPEINSQDMLSLQCVYAKVSAARWPMEDIEEFQYPGQRQDLFRVPSEIIHVPPSSSVDGSKKCYDIHVIEYTSEQWTMKADRELLSSKIISFGLKDGSSDYSERPATFRIHTPNRQLASMHAKCVYFDMGSKQWVGPDDVCEVTNDLNLAIDDYVDCSCHHLSMYAVKSKLSDAGLIGYPIWFFIACFFCMVSMALVILSHHTCSVHTTFSASLLMHMCFACMATQICYVVAAYLSPTEILVESSEDDNNRCIVMGLFLHYFFLTQFTWMLAQAANFWRILIMNDEHTDRKYIMFFLLGWGIPVLLVAIFYVVAFNIYKYAYSLPYEFIYGDINNRGDMCFITNAYTALGGVIVPVMLLLLIVGIVFVKAFQVTPQWQAYDDIYRGRYNVNEVRTLLGFWAIIIVTWLWGGLHMAYEQLWMLILFCIFTILQGLLALIFYAMLRNPFFATCFGPQKAMYAVSGETNDAMPTPPSHYQYTFPVEVASVHGSRASLLNDSWEHDSIASTRNTMTVKRSLPAHGNIFVTPPVLIHPADADQSDSKDFDDLVYALKSGGSYTPSEINSLDESDKISEISSKLDKYDVRRISIADTHL